MKTGNHSRESFGQTEEGYVLSGTCYTKIDSVKLFFSPHELCIVDCHTILVVLFCAYVNECF